MDCSCNASSCSDEHSPALFQSKVRKARKGHVCFECSRTIKKGETYEDVKGLWDGSFSSFKTCADCLSVRDEFFQGGYEFGTIWEAVSEYIRYCQGDIPEVCIRNTTLPSRVKLAAIIDEYDRSYQARGRLRDV